MTDTQSTQPAQPTRPDDTAGVPRQRAYRREETTGWVGWVVFAGVMMMVMGIFHVIQGITALVNSGYYAVPSSGLVVHFNFATWGWTHLILGAVVVVAGVAVMTGQMWARVIGIVLAVLSAIVNLGFLAAYPVWSTIIIALDVIVIYALAVHGGELKTRAAQPQ